MKTSIWIALSILKISLCIPLNQFYPFGNGTIEFSRQVPKGDTTTSPAINVQGVYHFFNQQQSVFYVSWDITAAHLKHGF